VFLLASSEAFLSPASVQSRRLLRAAQLEEETTSTTTKDDVDKKDPRVETPPTEPYWEIAPTMTYQQPRPLTEKLRKALETKGHPEESPDELGRGIFLTKDWREVWDTYESPPESPGLIDPETGFAEYEIDEIEGILPDDLVGTLYRNQPGKFGVGEERVQHFLDGHGLILKVDFPPPDSGRKPKFMSRFVETAEFKEEREAGRFLHRGVFGSGPAFPLFDNRPKNGLYADPIEPPLLARVLGNAGNVNIKNAANTQVISWGGKLLSLFESGLPHSLDPDTLETIGEDDLGGTLSKGLPVKVGGNVPSEFLPDFLGGSAHTAHPNVCPKTGNLVGWHWRQVVNNGSLEVTFTEWDEDFKQVASKTFEMTDCELAPHDMAITENCIIINVNAMKMKQLPFMLGAKGPASCLSMDGSAPITTWVFPRPTAKEQFEPYSVETPACFTLHFSHAYEDDVTGNLVSFFSGWPPSNSKDFLGAWSGYAPCYSRIPPTFLWRMEIDPKAKKCVSLDVAPGATNACIEHVLVHPNFNIGKAQNVYAIACNFVGDSSAPTGYARMQVESGRSMMLPEGEYNDEIDAYWFGTRYFPTEPLIVPKVGADLNNERDAYLVGVVQDASKKKSFVAVFDLEKDLSEGPICKLHLKSTIPHGLHGCFVPGKDSKSSIFC